MGYETAFKRWAGVGPYYAMFPMEFVDRVIETYSQPGDWVLDPFAGRASSVFSAAARGRSSVGIEINPVGWIYGKTKLSVAPSEAVKTRLDEILRFAQNLPPETGQDLPEFFRHCYTSTTLRFLLSAREHLNWKESETDRTLMALILIDLHGGRERSFSNQMRQSRAMSPEYSINWWKEKKLTPPEIDVKTFVEKKIKWRYAKGRPELSGSDVLLGDSSTLVQVVKENYEGLRNKGINLLFTSPPYIGISDYHRDQWLRLWMLGNEPVVARNSEQYRGSFSSAEEYRALLTTVFSHAAELMSSKGCVYVRTDARSITYGVTLDVLHSCFPQWKEQTVKQPYTKKTQTALYGDKSDKPGEIDIILFGPQFER